LTPADAPASEEIQQPLPELPVVVGDTAFSEAAFSGPPSTMMQEAYEHAASWGAYADPDWEQARLLWSSNLTRPTPKALVAWARGQSGRLAPHLRDQARRAEDARQAYENAQHAVARSVRQAAFVQQTRLLAMALDPTADDDQPFQ
jgi:hypothetical protein